MLGFVLMSFGLSQMTFAALAERRFFLADPYQVHSACPSCLSSARHAMIVSIVAEFRAFSFLHFPYNSKLVVRCVWIRYSFGNLCAGPQIWGYLLTASLDRHIRSIIVGKSCSVLVVRLQAVEYRWSRLIFLLFMQTIIFT